MNYVESIAKTKGLKVMLTVFKLNKPAIKFYEGRGYGHDDSCPSLDDGISERKKERISYHVFSRGTTMTPFLNG